ncbi:MAG: SPFH domain-containing protein [Planctomycetota bacterium]|nr:SPFH domain-containing protein [Planctomycetota bacterium]
MTGRSTENAAQPAVHGVMAILASLGLLGAGIGFAIAADERGGPEWWIIVGLIACFLLFPFGFIGLTLVNPNHAKVLLLFGRYKGTVRRPGFYWVNPFTVRRNVSLRVRNFESSKLKVNDELGNPIEIAAIVVWRVRDTAHAMLDVEDFEDYVTVQSESAVRQLATGHPYDSNEGKETSLRGSTEVVNRELQRELGERLELAGIDVLETRLSHLAYAPEIAGAMLRRQQAEAIISARTRIVDGAVGMVKLALDNLKSEGVIDLDEERRAQMVSNLLVVLCSERDVTPVVNTGTLHG